MLYRRLFDPVAPAEADTDTPEMAEAAALVDDEEAQLAMLKELAEDGMEMVKAQKAYAIARLAAATAAAADGGGLEAREDPAAAFNSLALTVRRTIALSSKLRAEIERRRAGLNTERAKRRTRRAAEHAAAVKEAVDDALTDIYYAEGTPPPFDPKADPKEMDAGEIERWELLSDAEYLLEDLDEHRNWLKRPVGEAVAMLCKSLGLSPEACIQRDGQWLVRRTPTTYETLREKGPSCLPKSPRPSGPDGIGRQYGLGADVDDPHRLC